MSQYQQNNETNIVADYQENYYSGWVKTYRSIANHWIWTDKPFSKGQAFIDLIMLANHKDNKFMFNGQLTECKRGQFITSEIKLMERWGWSKSKLKRFLKMLEDDQMVIKKTDNKKTSLTILNYGIYQDCETAEDTAKEHQKDIKKTSKRHQKDTNKNVKNNKNEKNEKEIPESKLPEVCYKFSNWFKENCFPVSKTLPTGYYQQWAEVYDKLTRIDKYNKDEIEAVCLWATSDPFWSTNIFSPAKLRKKDENGVKYYEIFRDRMNLVGAKEPEQAPVISPEKQKFLDMKQDDVFKTEDGKEWVKETGLYLTDKLGKQTININDFLKTYKKIEFLHNLYED
jgi:hypothetical protein